MQEQIDKDLKEALLGTMSHPFGVSATPQNKFCGDPDGNRAGKMEYILSGCSSRGIRK